MARLCVAEQHKRFETNGEPKITQNTGKQTQGELHLWASVESQSGTGLRQNPRLFPSPMNPGKLNPGKVNPCPQFPSRPALKTLPASPSKAAPFFQAGSTWHKQSSNTVAGGDQDDGKPFPQALPLFFKICPLLHQPGLDAAHPWHLGHTIQLLDYLRLREDLKFWIM